MSSFERYQDAHERVAEIKESHGLVPEIKPYGSKWRLTFDPDDKPLDWVDDPPPPAGNYTAMITRAQDDDPLVQKPLRGLK